MAKAKVNKINKTSINNLQSTIEKSEGFLKQTIEDAQIKWKDNISKKYTA